MKAAYITRTGSADVIIYGEQPVPKPVATECLVEVRAVDVNPIDTYIRSGSIASKIQFPYILGRDLAGKVVETGDKVSRFKPGDRVWASGQGVGSRQGTFSEFAVVEQEWLHPIPDGVRDEEVVAIALVGITAHLGLVRHVRVQP